jgi:hypothetical protein
MNIAGILVTVFGCLVLVGNVAVARKSNLSDANELWGTVGSFAILLLIVAIGIGMQRRQRKR